MSAVPALIVAVMVIVTLPPAGMPPFQVTVLPAVAAAVPRGRRGARPASGWTGRTSVSSLPALSGDAELPELEITMV